MSGLPTSTGERMTFVPVGRAQAQTYRIASYLRRTYTEWTADLTAKPRIPYLRWINLDDRDAYYLLCDLHSLPKEA